MWGGWHWGGTEVTGSAVTDPDTALGNQPRALRKQSMACLCACKRTLWGNCCSQKPRRGFPCSAGAFGSQGGGQASPRVTSDVGIAGDPQQQPPHSHGFHSTEGDGGMDGWMLSVLQIHQLLLFLQLQVAGFVLKAQFSPHFCPGSLHPSERPSMASSGCSES